MGELLKLSSISLLSLFPSSRDSLNFSSWIGLFSPLDSMVFSGDHSSFSCSSTKGTWSFVSISLVDPLGLLPFLLGFLYGSHSRTSFFTTFYWVICTLFKALSSCFFYGLVFAHSSWIFLPLLQEFSIEPWVLHIHVRPMV